MLARTRRLLTYGLAVAAVTAVLAGCGSTGGDTDLADGAPSTARSDADPEDGPEGDADGIGNGNGTETPAGNASPTPTDDPAAEETAGAPDSPAATPSRSAARDRGLRGQLLTADELPGLNDAFHWQEVGTRLREGRRPFGTCHRFAMTSLGAQRVAVRGYAAADAGSTGESSDSGPSASNLVARFPDEMTARRAYAVLSAWHDQCEEQLSRFDQVDVGRLTPVDVGTDAVGGWYLLVYGPAGGPDSAWFDAQGMTRSGSTISVLQMRLQGQDYNYPSGEEPMVGAVTQAARIIG